MRKLAGGALLLAAVALAAGVVGYRLHAASGNPTTPHASRIVPAPGGAPADGTDPARLLPRRFFGTMRLNGWQRAYLSCLLHRYPGWTGPLPRVGSQPTPRAFHAAMLACGADLPRAPGT